MRAGWRGSCVWGGRVRARSAEGGRGCDVWSVRANGARRGRGREGAGE